VSLTFLDRLTEAEIKRRYERLKALGEIDRAFVPYCDRINSHQGITTTQCCTGHGRDGGYLSLKVNRRMFDAMLHDVCPAVWSAGAVSQYECSLCFEGGRIRMLWRWSRSEFRRFINVFMKALEGCL